MVNVNNLQFGKELAKILDIYTEDNFTKGDKESLDGDEVDKLIDILKPQLNLINGNITEDEYQTALDIRLNTTVRITKESFLNWYFESGSDQEQDDTVKHMGNLAKKHLLGAKPLPTAQDLFDEVDITAIPQYYFEGFDLGDTDEIGDSYSEYKLID